MSAKTRSRSGCCHPAWIGLYTLAIALTAACGDDDDSSTNHKDAGGDTPADCDITIKKGYDTEAIQTVLIEAKTKSTICFEDGTYHLDRELSLSVNDVTLRGNAKDRSKVVLDYADQTEGKDALSVSGDGFTIEHLTLRNSHGNAIVVEGAERVTFRDLKVSWDAGSVTTNGAYAVYPLGCTHVLVEDCEVQGASDAGIYVGQSKNIIVRNNVVHGNVTGIEIENSEDALVTGNRAYDNTAGILVFVLPNLERKSGKATIVEDNELEMNNRENFGQPGTTVSFAPQGLGMLVLANDETEIRKNTFTGNETTGVMAISYSTFTLICMLNGGKDCVPNDPMTDPDLSKLYVHDNTFTDNGKEPDPGVVAILGTNLENVLWDGRKPPSAVDEDQLCLGPNGTSVRQFGNQDGIYGDRSKDVTDPKEFDCTLPAPFEKIDLPQEP
ncbi:MAG TPA: parallel beta-helix domain-containing protein [Polyangiales bacterium]|nr:parallel beta-helix domain-containing protein [Polyangiales bacterium]